MWTQLKTHILWWWFRTNFWMLDQLDLYWPFIYTKQSWFSKESTRQSFLFKCSYFCFKWRFHLIEGLPYISGNHDSEVSTSKSFLFKCSCSCLVLNGDSIWKKYNSNVFNLNTIVFVINVKMRKKLTATRFKRI
jgi:hypothetical protein